MLYLNAIDMEESEPSEGDYSGECSSAGPVAAAAAALSVSEYNDDNHQFAPSEGDYSGECSSAGPVATATLSEYDDDNHFGGAEENDEEDGKNQPLDTPLNEKNIIQDDVVDDDGDYDDNGGADQRGRAKQTSSRIRKKVKHRHCKAAIMIFFIWSITLIFISTALGTDWMGIDRDANCILCGGENGLDFDETTNAWPTRLPSSSEATRPFDKVKPPPADLAELCAPSIRLQGTQHNTANLIENCMKACLPAVCCLVNNDDAKEGLLSMLGLQDLSDNQASAYLSTIEDCYSGDDVLVCDAYQEWCSTLYSLDFVLEESLPGHFFDTCHRKQEHDGGIIMAASRAFDPATAGGDCGELCRPLACCYENEYKSDSRVRKRYRQHKYNMDSRSYSLEAQSTRRGEEQECHQFRTQDSLNAQICDAYSPFCNPFKHSRNSDFGYPSFVPSGAPTKMQSISPSMRSSYHPSISPSRQATQTSDSALSYPSLEPSDAQAKMRSLSPSMHPLYRPSISPSRSDSSALSYTSFEPSGAPTQVRSLSPSMYPNLSPSRQAAPTSFESTLSSSPVVPSGAPTRMPSLSPSMQFTDVPSISPSQPASPTSLESTSSSSSVVLGTAPSHMPSLSPITHFTDLPSISPSWPATPTFLNSTLSSSSFLPSDAPAQMPSFNPSMPSTDHPSTSPSRPETPSSLDSTLSYSSSEPNGTPTHMPSLSPSTQSTDYPSILPYRPATPISLQFALSSSSVISPSLPATPDSLDPPPEPS